MTLIYFLIQLQMRGVFFDNLLKLCIFCNTPVDKCACPAYGTKSKFISDICQKPLKRKKWITIVIGSVTQIDFKIIKDKLGTGGNYFESKIQLRGRVKDRVKSILGSLGYTCM